MKRTSDAVTNFLRIDLPAFLSSCVFFASLSLTITKKLNRALYIYYEFVAIIVIPDILKNSKSIGSSYHLQVYPTI